MDRPQWDPQVKQTVLYGTVSAGLFGATTGATLAILRNHPIRPYAVGTGINCSIFAFTFLSVRETFLAYQRIKNPTFGLKDSQTRDADALWSSAMAGGTIGGILSGIWRGPRGIIPGFVIFGLLSSAGQVLVSSANRYRQSLILNSTSEPSVQISASLHANPYLPQHETVYDKDPTFQHGIQTYPRTKTAGGTERKSMWDFFQVPKWSPVRKLTDEEYKAILDSKLRELEAEVEELTQELGDIKGSS
ncbi:hypothetical protein BZG36_05123 [Bifiguratus adelaidae]|uniref:Uncharacterized protein n=1 Tax=Bifiguratus adelaidae TaxID=1938954 RepID=A0A261XU98_9FUNG|nr:hypothetical protein BZG36_05123 [Bifiguratus adelaidae]